MRLATRCPSCATLFLVVPDQLRVSDGWVRCGRCANVFNAADDLLNVETGAPVQLPQALPEAASGPDTIGPSTAAAPAWADTSGADASAEPDDPPRPHRSAGRSASAPPAQDLAFDPSADLGPAAAPEGRPAHVAAEPAERLGPRSADDPGDDRGWPVPMRSASPAQPPSRWADSRWLDGQDDDLPEQLLRAPSEPMDGERPRPPVRPPWPSPTAPTRPTPPAAAAPEAAAERLPAPVAAPSPAPAAPPTPATPLTEAPPSAEAPWPAPRPAPPRPDPQPSPPPEPVPAWDADADLVHPDPDPEAAAQAEAALAALHEPDLLLPDDEAERSGPPTAPSFLRSAERAARWRQSRWRSGLQALAVLMGVLLLGQLALLWRDSLAARAPALAPALHAACKALGCQVQPLRQIDQLAVDSSGLKRVDEVPGAEGYRYRFSVLLHNRATIALMAPAMELTLTDPRGDVVIRRVLQLADFGLTDQPVAAGQELPLRLLLATGDRRIEGYTVELFYP